MSAKQVKYTSGVNLDVLHGGMPAPTWDDGPQNNELDAVPQPEWAKKFFTLPSSSDAESRKAKASEQTTQFFKNMFESIQNSPRRSENSVTAPTPTSTQYSAQAEFVPGSGMYDPTLPDTQFKEQWAAEQAQALAPAQEIDGTKPATAEKDKPTTDILVNDKNSNVIIKEISDADFAKLSTLEQDSVRYNTLLNQALKSDDARSDVTNLVKGLGLKTGDITIDDMLANEGFISDRDFSNLRPSGGGLFSKAPEAIAAPDTRSAKGDIATRMANLRGDLNDGVISIGGVDTNLSGYGDIRARLDEYLRRTGVDSGSPLSTYSQKDAEFDAAFEYMAQRNPAESFTYEDVVSSLTAAGYDPEEFLQYVGNRISVARTSLANNTAASLGTRTDIEYLTPDEMISTWGLTIQGG